MTAVLPWAAFSISGLPTTNWPIASTLPVASSCGSAGGAEGMNLTFAGSMPAALA